MPLSRRAALALFLPFFVAVVLVLAVVCALDRWTRLSWAFPRDPRALARPRWRRWAVRKLRRAGALSVDAEVIEIAVTPFKAGEAFRSSLATLTLTVADAAGPPAGRRVAVLAKFAPAGGSVLARVVFVLQRLHLNEVGFYRQIAGLGPTPLGRPVLAVPRAYWAGAAPVTGNFCLLLARVEAIVEHTEEEGCPLDAAAVVMHSLANFHAAWWQPAPNGRRRPRFPPPISDFTIDFACSLAFGRRRKTLRRLARSAWRQGNMPQTLIHGDARVGNVLFGAGPAAGTATLIDWQAVRWGRAAFDVAYFILLSLTSADREAHGEGLVATYHAALVAAGVSDYARAALDEDLRHALVLVGTLLVVPLLGGEITVDDANRERVLSGALVWNQRLVRALEVVDTEWLATRYRLSRDELSALVDYCQRHPPVLNRGACLVARHRADTV